jgi:hypothetical protein
MDGSVAGNEDFNANVQLVMQQGYSYPEAYAYVYNYFFGGGVQSQVRPRLLFVCFSCWFVGLWGSLFIHLLSLSFNILYIYICMYVFNMHCP